MDLAALLTEQANPASAQIDQLSTPEMLRVINAEDRKVAETVAAEIPHIAQAVDAIAAGVRQRRKAFLHRRGNQRKAGRARCFRVSADVQRARRISCRGSLPGANRRCRGPPKPRKTIRPSVRGTCRHAAFVPSTCSAASLPAAERLTSWAPSTRPIGWAR